MAHLKQISLDTKRKIAAWRLDNLSYAKIAKRLLEEEEIEVTAQTVRNFCVSEDGENLLRESHDLLKKQWGDQPLAEKFSRVHALVQQANRLREKLDDETVGTPDYYKLSNEYRQYLVQLNKEMEPITIKEIASPESDAPYSKFMSKLRESFTEDELRLIGVPEDSTVH